ncbi:unannotated protein [freshwater metagenome]|uniref:Unannotated protein n=1 Tax=freshwater metagenome TaxID=449393 RepID=A0A6J7HJH2_9ZZZZ
MDHIVINESAQYLADRIRLANGGQELIPKPRAFAGAFHDSGDVNEHDGCRQDLLGPKDAR